MCRIVGFWDLTNKKDYDINKTIISMRDTMTHGGPDDAGVYVDKNSGIALGHRRLSILDLTSSGHQPMSFENLTIVYNGEVYNYAEIKKDLVKYGYTFISNTDTEVVLKAFHRWGYEAVHRFRGMFAFAIWDADNRRLILCRDRVGVKPLYWYFNEGLFMFASEIKAFHKHPKFKKVIDKKGLALYLQYGYITAPYTIFENVYKLEPGCFLEVNSSGKIEIKKYWDIEKYFTLGVSEQEKFFKKSEDEIAEELEYILTDSFKLRLVSDVPVGVFLSGGIDSSTVTAILAKEGIRLKTFTIGFHEGEYNEAPYAKEIANYLGTDHTELYCSPKEALDIIPKLPELYDEPFGDPSAIPTYLVSKLAKERVKVSLSADGGDEQFCGYTKYQKGYNRLKFIYKYKKIFKPLIGLFNLHILYRHLSLPINSRFFERYNKLFEIINEKGIIEGYDIINKFYITNDLSELGINNGLINHINIQKVTNLQISDDMSLFMLLDFKTYLPDDILVKVDRATMGVSLEGREPFLDHHLVEYTSKLPIQYKYKHNQTKYILKKILYKYIPKNLLDRPKQGFTPPIYKWLNSDLQDLYFHYITRLKKSDIFEASNFIDKALFLKRASPYKAWLLFILSIWYEKWVEK